MKTKYFSIVISLLVCISIIEVEGQQTYDFRFNYLNQFLRNPAAISPLDRSFTSANYQSAFSAIENPPVNSFVSLQYPIPNQNISFGLGLRYESASLIDDISAQLGASYKIRGIFNDLDYLSFGTSATLYQIRLRGKDAIVNNAQDPLVTSGFQSAFGVNVHVGAMYATRGARGKKRSVTDGNSRWIIGFSAGQILPQNTNLETFSYDEQFFIYGHSSLEIKSSNIVRLIPMVEVMLEEGNAINGRLSVRSIFGEALVVGASYDLHNALGLEVGYQMGSITGRQLGLSSGSQLFISVNANLPFGQIDSYINSGFGASVSYFFSG